MVWLRKHHSLSHLKAVWWLTVWSLHAEPGRPGRLQINDLNCKVSISLMCRMCFILLLIFSLRPLCWVIAVRCGCSHSSWWLCFAVGVQQFCSSHRNVCPDPDIPVLLEWGAEWLQRLWLVSVCMDGHMDWHMIRLMCYSWKALPFVCPYGLLIIQLHYLILIRKE